MYMQKVLFMFAMFTSFIMVMVYVSDFLFKFLVIGSAGTGKSCILHQFIENKCKWVLVTAHVTCDVAYCIYVPCINEFVYLDTKY